MKSFVIIAVFLVVIIIGSVVIFSNFDNEKNEQIKTEKKTEMSTETKAKFTEVIQGALVKNFKPNFSRKRSVAGESKVVGSFSTEKWSSEKKKEFLNTEIKKNMEFFRKGFYRFVMSIWEEFLLRPENADNVKLEHQDLSYEVFEQEFNKLQPDFLKLLEDPIAQTGFELIRDELYGKYNYDEESGFPDTNREKMMDDFTGNFTDYLGMMAEESIKKSLGSNVNLDSMNFQPEVRVEVIDSDSAKKMNLESGVKVLDSGSEADQEELNRLMKELDAIKQGVIQ